MVPPAPTTLRGGPGRLPSPPARGLAAASLSANTRRSYSGALRRLAAWLDGRPLEDAATYLAELHDQGRAPSSSSTAVAAARFRARLAGDADPGRGNGPPGCWPADRRWAAGCGPARPFVALALAAVLATCHRQRCCGRRGRPEARLALRADVPG